MIEFEAVELYDAHANEQRDAEAVRAEQVRVAREKIDTARLAMAELAEPAVYVLACRLMGVDKDNQGVSITDEREKAALTILDRVGIGRTRMNSIRSTIAFETEVPAAIYGAFGKMDEGSDSPGREDAEVDAGTVDAQISAFLEGARIARDVRGEK